MKQLRNTIGKLEVDQSIEAPEEHDWRDHSAVSAVKDQASCGSCWAFSAVGNIEGINAIKNPSAAVKTFSEQQLVDCDKVDAGCNGGLMTNAFTYITQAGGLLSDADYKYTARRGTCRFSKDKVAVKINGYVTVGEDEEEMKKAVHQTGPLAIAINASSFQWYDEGILDESAAECNPAGLNHGVTLVGYGVENGTPYWTIKNSWGKSWGETGYIRIARGKGTCGLNKDVSSAVLA